MMKTANPKNIKPKNIPFFITPSPFKNDLEKAA
jgi:hypothetical protein